MNMLRASARPLGMWLRGSGVRSMSSSSAMFMSVDVTLVLSAEDIGT